MKKKYKFLTVAMVLVLSLSLFTGCGSNDADEQTTDDDSSQSSTLESHTDDDSTDSADDTIVEDIIGEITDISTYYITLNVYEADTEIYDYTTLDTSTLASTENSESVSIDTDAEYYYVFDGSLVSQTADDLSVGDLIAITTDSDGNQQVILLVQQTENFEEDTSEDMIAEVTAVEGDVLTLKVYEAFSTDYLISDYASVNFEDFTATETEEIYTLDSSVEVSVAENSVLTMTDSSEITVGDMLVFYTTENGNAAIAVYHAE